MARKPLVILVVVVAVFLGLLALVPAGYHFKKEERITAPPAVVYAQIAELAHWQDWGPLLYADDSTLKTSLEGPASGPGAKLVFSGDGVGAGSLTVRSATPPSQVVLELAYTRPEVSQATITLSIAPNADLAGQTDVVWQQQGTNGFPQRLFAVVMDRGYIMGRDVERALGALKINAQVEANKLAAPPEPAPAEADGGDEAAAPDDDEGAAEAAPEGDAGAEAADAGAN